MRGPRARTISVSTGLDSPAPPPALCSSHPHQPLAGRRQRETNITIVRVQRIMNLLQFDGREDAYKGGIGIKLEHASFNCFRSQDGVQADINRRQDPSWAPQQMRCEDELFRQY